MSSVHIHALIVLCHYFYYHHYVLYSALGMITNLSFLPLLLTSVLCAMVVVWTWLLAYREFFRHTNSVRLSNLILTSSFSLQENWSGILKRLQWFVSSCVQVNDCMLLKHNPVVHFMLFLPLAWHTPCVIMSHRAQEEWCLVSSSTGSSNYRDSVLLPVTLLSSTACFEHSHGGAFDVRDSQ